MMYIKQVKIQDFKNFNSLVTFNFESGTNIINGKNGVGKTTILDAIVWVLRGRLFSGAQDGWKPKELFIDEHGNAISRHRDNFNTLVEVTIGFDDGQKDLVLKRTSFCGKSTVPYYNGVTDTQKQINKYLEKALGFSLDKLLIYTNPEILFSSYAQEECGKLIYDSVYHKVEDQINDLFTHIFDDYNNTIEFLEENSEEKAIAQREKNEVLRKLGNKVSENKVIEDIEEKIKHNQEIQDVKNETIVSQKLVLDDYKLKLKQEPVFKILEQNLDKQEQLLRSKLFDKNHLENELTNLQKAKNALVVWLDDFNNLLKTNPSNTQIKIAFGLPVDKMELKDVNVKINVLQKDQQKIKCPVCGNWYLPKQDKSLEKNLLAAKQSKVEQPSKTEVFDYVPKLTEIKTQIDDLKQQIETLETKISSINKSISGLEYRNIEELQKARNEVSTFFAGLEQGKKIQKQVEIMQNTCESCKITNRYLNLLLDNIKVFVKKKFRIIMKKLNQNLSSGIITLFKLQANGTYKECCSIIDKSSNANYAETNQSKKIKLGIEVCKLLQDFNDINIPIFIDEVGRFNDYSFISTLGHQVIATLPTNEDTIRISH